MNRQWLLERHPADTVTNDCFRYVEGERPKRPGPGTVLVRWEMFLCAPTIRNWISGNRASFYPTVELGAPVMAPGLGRVIESEDPEFPVGTRLFGAASWQDEQWIDPRAMRSRRIAAEVSTTDAMGIFGLNALTAYVGLMRVGQPKKGETLLVSGAAGSVGSIAVQLGRIQDCHVIGICGGQAKRRWLREQCGIKDVIDYKSDDVAERLGALAPGGIDIYFDNVGGPILKHVIARMNRFGRVVLCGQISTYDRGVDDKTPALDMMRIIYGNIRLQGFIVSDHADMFEEAMAKLAQWDRAGQIRHREDVRSGFKNIPDTFRQLFSGGNEGTLLVRIADDVGNPL